MRSCSAFSMSSCARSLPYWRFSSETAWSPAEERPPPALGEVSRKRSRMDSTEGWPNENALPAGEKMTVATSTPQRMESSLTFLKSPAWRLEKHTCHASGGEEAGQGRGGRAGGEERRRGAAGGAFFYFFENFFYPSWEYQPG